MIECVCCYSSSKDNYIFTECSHLICGDCASSKWDGRYSLKCCNQLTFLSEDTAEVLSLINQQKMHIRVEQTKENDQSAFEYVRTPLQRSRHKENLEQSYCQRVKLEQSQLVRSITPKKEPVYQEDERDQALNQMEKLLAQQVSLVKFNYEQMRKELERKEQILLKQLYNTYSDHMNSLKNTCSRADVYFLKQKLQRISENDPPRVIIEREEVRPDKILEKLDYNQQKMKQKLHKHYELLK